jgi:hypothetical protein
MPDPSRQGERYRGGNGHAYDNDGGGKHHGNDGHHNDGHHNNNHHGHHNDCDWDDWDCYDSWHCGGWGVYVGFDWGWYYGYGWSPGYWGPWYWRTWWPEPVTIAYVPYGFYSPQPVVWVDEVRVVEQVPVYVREQVVVEGGVPSEVPPPDEGPLVVTGEYQGNLPAPGAKQPAAPAEEEVREPLQGGPPQLDEVTERYLREGSTAFAAADYAKAAESFRLAAVSAPAVAAPRFAFGQALIGMGEYAYAARVLREALTMETAIFNAPGSIAGVYRDAVEFERVLKSLKDASLEKRNDPDLLFLVGYQQYFSGDPQATVTFSRLREAAPQDPALALFEPALKTRFAAFSSLPPVGGAK